MSDNNNSRTVKPRKWTLAGTVAASALAVAHPVMVAGLSASAVVHGSVAEASEGGESGEAGVTLTEGPATFLTKLGYFEGTYRIILALYLSDERELARAHMEESHHAWYDDIEPQLTEYDAPGFADEDAAFTAAVATNVSDADVQAAFEALIAAMGHSASASGASLRDQVMSLKDLMALSAAEYGGGVEEGAVEIPIEYRDSWGFYETARERAVSMSQSGDAATAKAGADVLKRLGGLDALYPSLTAETASNDASPLAGAAAWIEIIALKQN